MRINRRRIILAILLFIALMAFLFTLISCNADEDPAQTRLEIRIEAEDTQESRTIMPAHTLMEIAKYSVSGTGPDGASFGPVLSSENTMSIQDLVAGTWEISAKALNVENNEIASGSGTFEISQGDNSAVVVLDRMEGAGSLQLDFTWESSICSESMMRISITLDDSKGGVITKTRDVPTSDCSTSVVMNAPAGSHILSVKVLDSRGFIGIGATDAVRIVSNTRSAGSVRLETYRPQPSGSGTEVSLQNNIGFPMSFYIDYSPKNPVRGRSVTLRACYESLPAGVSASDLIFQWYKDGEVRQLDKTGSFTITAESGLHRYDVIVRSPVEGTMCGATLSLSIPY
ncbi:MAG: hypothetical protein ILP16_05070 [Spirochaetales bacterium]|nr:hypothetical protein [Spirochaetales bacterium]